MNTYTELNTHCTTFSDSFDSIHEIALAWGYTNNDIAKGIQKILRFYSQKKASDEYAMGNVHNYILAEIFQSPENIRLLMKQDELDSKPEGYQVLAFLEKHPAFWCYFSVKEHLFDDLWSIVDLMSGEEHILHSPVITAMQKWDDAETLRFLGLVMSNGECLHAIGITKYTRLPVSEFLYYCSLFKPEQGLQEILSKHFAQFSQLDNIHTFIPVMVDTHEMGFAWHAFPLPHLAIEKLAGRWIHTTLGDHQCYTTRVFDPSTFDSAMLKLYEKDSRALGCTILMDNATGEGALFTNTEIAFTLYADMLNKAYPTLALPQKPSVFIGAALRALIQEEGLPVPWKKYEPIIKYRKSKKRKQEIFQEEWEEFLVEFKRSTETKRPFSTDIITLLNEAHIREITPKVDEVCKATGLHRNDAELLIRRFAQKSNTLQDGKELAEDLVFIVSDEDKEFVLTGWPKPDDGDGRFLLLDLTDSELFDFNNVDEAYTGFAQLADELYLQEIRKYGMVNRIEALFATSFAGDLSFSSMNTFFWLLHHHGREWIPVRSYAIEMLKWIPHTIFQYFYYSEEFIKFFSQFTQKFLCTKGICSLKARPTAKQVQTSRYAIKGTEAFYSLLKIAEGAIDLIDD